MAHVLIVGAGFGGLTLARALRRADVDVTVVDRTNHHLFQPLLYQVAMAGLNPADIAVPIRGVLRRQRRTRVLLAEVVDFDLPGRAALLSDGERLGYDFLVVAAGARTAWFGHEDWARHALGLKDLDDALEIRRRVLLGFEAAEREPDGARRKRLLTFVVIGGGPTGVEVAGAIAELARHVLARDFRTIDPTHARVILMEGHERLVRAFAPELSVRAAEQLRDLGVEVRTGVRVTGLDGEGVHVGDETVPAAVIVWAAGVGASPLGAKLGVACDAMGRVPVGADLSLPGHPEVFVIGDLARVEDAAGEPLPGLSPVAMQQARSVARNVARSLRGQTREPFRYFDKGIMATIGRSRAVAQAGRLKLSGLPAWIAWLVIHLYYLIEFRNRLFVLLAWFWAYVRYRHGARLITGHVLPARTDQAAR